MKKLLLLFLAFCCNAFGQPLSGDPDSLTATNDSAKTHKLSIVSNLENAKIFFDTVYIGMTPLYNYNVNEGNYKIRIHNPKSLRNWETENHSIDLFIDKDTTLNVDFRYYYFFKTEPFGAKVLLNNDSLLGISPLRMFSDDELMGNLIFKKKNYKDFVFDLKTYDFETGANITLKSKGIETINDVVYKNKGTQFNTRRAVIPILSLAAASIAGGYLAINFKNKANNEYDKYLISGSPESLDESKKNDTYFVVTLVLMQAAVGALIYFLFFD